MDNKLTIVLGGEETTIDFGKMKFLKCLGIVVKKDAFDVLDSAIWTDPEKAFRSAVHFIHAGLISNGKEVTAEQVEKWVEELDTSLLKDIQYAVFSAITGKGVDELKNRVAQLETLAAN